MFLLKVPLGIGYIIIGLIYSPSVVTGLHQMYTAIDVSMLAKYGVTYWLPIASAANIAQGGACLAVALRTKSEKTKSLAVPSGISCLLGITEPAIFGVNLPKIKPFVAGMIGSACGALCCYIFNLAASGTGVTGIFGILLCIAQPVQYIIMFAVAFGVAFGITSTIYKDEEKAKAAKKSDAPKDGEPKAMVAPQVDASAANATTLVSPMTGTALPLSQVSDPVFASESMGKGAAVEPTEGAIYAPCDGEVTLVANTGHALVMMSDAGCEVLLHIGIDTVELKGAPFTAHVNAGDHVKAGQLLMEADLDQIKAAGKAATTMVIVTNSDDFKSIEGTSGAVVAGASLVKLSK